MTTVREEILRSKTFKEPDAGPGQRTLAVLGDQGGLYVVTRSTKLLSLVVEHLVEHGLISDDELDEMLLRCVV
jgi:hypothetical protein